MSNVDQPRIAKGTPKRGGQWSSKHTGEAGEVDLVDVQASKRAAEDAYQVAKDRYFAAASELVALLPARIGAQVQSACPEAVSIVVEGEYNEDAVLSLSVVDVSDSDGETLGGETAENVEDAVKDDLMLLGELSGEDFLGRFRLSIPDGAVDMDPDR